MRLGLLLAVLAAIFACPAGARADFCTTHPTHWKCQPPPPPPPPSGEPAPIVGQGYSRVFSDEFDTLDRAVWDDHIWYQPAAQPGAQSVETGVLHLRSFASQGFKPTTVTTKTSGRTWTRGYFEARMKWPVCSPSCGAWPAFWLLSYRHATDPVWPAINPYCANNGLPTAECWNAELDVMDEGDVPTTHFVGLHRNTSGGYGQPDQLAPYPNWFPQAVNLSADWHVYSAEWTATEVRFYLDNALVSAVPTFDSTNQPLFMLLQNWTGNGCWKCGTPTADTDVRVDWVRVWQR